MPGADELVRRGRELAAGSWAACLVGWERPPVARQPPVEPGVRCDQRFLEGGGLALRQGMAFVAEASRLRWEWQDRRNPNNPGLEDRSQWNFKASGSYDAPYGIRISPVIRHQSGANYARTAAISDVSSAPSTNAGPPAT